MTALDNNIPASWGITLLRVSLGAMWISHALLKALVYTLPGAVKFFVSVGLPGVLVYPVFTAEIIGGLALILGIYARQASLALIPIMAVVVWVHFPNGWVHSSTGGGWEYPAFLIVISLSIWLIGDGALVIRRSDRFTLSH